MGEICDHDHLYWTQFQVKRFYQVLSSGFHRRLVSLESIPSKLVQCLKDDLSRTDSSMVFLKGPSNKTWKVELMGIQDSLFFQNGWSDFVRDHSLKEGNVLFFIYRGNLNFDVFMFDHESLCEKPCSYFKCQISKRRSLKYPVEATPSTQIPHIRTSSKRPPRCNRVKSPLISRSTKPISAKRKLISDDVELDSSSSDSSSTDTPAPAPVRRLQSWNLLPVHESNRGPVTEEEKQRVKQMAEAASASLPKSFFVVMRPSHVYRRFVMTIPCNFVEKHFPRRNKEVTLCCDRKRFNVTFHYRKSSGGGVFMRGWIDFVFMNNIEEDDVCFFELVDDKVTEENEQDTVFNVRIFRVVDEIVPLSRCNIPQQRFGRSQRGEASSASGRGRGRGRGRRRRRSFFT